MRAPITARTGSHARSCENPDEVCSKRLVRGDSSGVDFLLWSGHICWLCAKFMHRFLSTLLVLSLTIAPAASQSLHALAHEHCADSNCQLWWRATILKRESSVDRHPHHHECSHSTGDDHAISRDAAEHSADSESSSGTDSLPREADGSCQICVTLFAPFAQAPRLLASEEPVLRSIMSFCCSPVLMSMRELPYESRGPPAV